jgi:hypothetical protein
MTITLQCALSIDATEYGPQQLPHRYSRRSAMACTWSRRADASTYVMPYLRQQGNSHSDIVIV